MPSFTSTFAEVTSDSEGANSNIYKPSKPRFPRQTLPLKGIAHPRLIRGPLALDRRHRPSRRGADPARAGGRVGCGGVSQLDGLGAEGLQQNCIYFRYLPSLLVKTSSILTVDTGADVKVGDLIYSCLSYESKGDFVGDI